jgi:epsilon-lactone hydrolase
MPDPERSPYSPRGPSQDHEATFHLAGMMRLRFCALTFGLAALAAYPHAALARQAEPSAPQEDSSYIDAQGTARITRVIPLPETISPQARKYLARPVANPGPNDTLAEKRARTDAMQLHNAKENRALYPVNIASSTIAGIPVRIVTPIDPIPTGKLDRVLINVHGGGFTTDSGSLTESIPIANLTRTKVVAVLYRLAPEHPFPAAVDDTIAVYKELLRAYKAQHIAIYGASAGGILTGEVAVKIKQLGLPLPGALGIFTGTGDFGRLGDTQAIYSVTGLAGHLNPPREGVQWLADYVGSANPKDPVLSPLYADLHGMPPTLFLTSTRDMMLSGTAILHRAFLRAGVDAQLVVFEALNHGFWYEANLPESREADEIIARFFDAHLATRK